MHTKDAAFCFIAINGIFLHSVVLSHDIEASVRACTTIPKACDYTGNNGTTANPYGTGPRRSNPVQRAMSKSAGKRPPPLPPPNKGMYDSLTEQNKGWLIHCSLYMQTTRLSLKKILYYYTYSSPFDTSVGIKLCSI